MEQELESFIAIDFRIQLELLKSQQTKYGSRVNSSGIKSNVKETSNFKEEAREQERIQEDRKIKYRILNSERRFLSLQNLWIQNRSL